MGIKFNKATLEQFMLDSAGHFQLFQQCAINPATRTVTSVSFNDRAIREFMQLVHRYTIDVNFQALHVSSGICGFFLTQMARRSLGHFCVEEVDDPITLDTYALIDILLAHEDLRGFGAPNDYITVVDDGDADVTYPRHGYSLARKAFCKRLVELFEITEE